MERRCRIFPLVVFQPRCQSEVVRWWRRGSGLVLEVVEVVEVVEVDVDVKVDVQWIRLDPT